MQLLYEDVEKQKKRREADGQPRKVGEMIDMLELR